MVIQNHTKNSSLAKKEKHCYSISSKARGLMFSPKLVDEGIIFHFDEERNIDLHMLFVFQKIDAVWLNSDKEVVGLKEGLKPFVPFIRAPAPARYVIEVASGTIKNTDTKIGDRISF